MSSVKMPIVYLCCFTHIISSLWTISKFQLTDLLSSSFFFAFLLSSSSSSCILFLIKNSVAVCSARFFLKLWLQKKGCTENNSCRLWSFLQLGFDSVPFGETWNVASALPVLSSKPPGESQHILLDALGNIIVGTEADFIAAASWYVWWRGM